MSATDALYREVLALRAAVARARPEGTMPLPLDRHATNSLRNLAQYVALQSSLSGRIEDALADHGLASLDTAAPHVLATLDNLLARLAPTASTGVAAGTLPPVGIEEAHLLATAAADALFGAPRPGGSIRVMVTAPVGAPDEEATVEALLLEGIEVLRINGSTAGSEGLASTLAALRRAQERTGQRCRVLVDLTGRKIRTGPVTPDPAVVRLRPRRDALGKVVEHGRAWLTPRHELTAPPRPVDAVIPVPAAWLSRLVAGSEVDFEDARGAKRSLKVLAAWPEGCLCGIEKTAYIQQGTLLHHRGAAPEELAAWGAVDGVPEREGSIRLRTGDTLVITDHGAPGEAAVLDAWGTAVRPAHIGCFPAAALDNVQPGHRVVLDDGKLAGVVEQRSPDGLHVRITLARRDRVRLRAGRGIDFPDSLVALPALSPEDEALLPTIAAEADMVGFSFVESVEDVQDLQQRLADLGASQLGLVLKIETARAAERLPDLIAAALGAGPVGVMIARGDLAIMAGYEQLPGLQRKILSTARAAHVPAIWASQVLDQLARRGVPTRAEMTDLAAAVEADCVMLNKGAYVLKAVRSVRDCAAAAKPATEMAAAVVRVPAASAVR